MEKSLTLSVLCVGFVLLDAVNSFPIDISSVGEGASNPLWLTNYFLTGFGFFLIIVSVILGCVCCRNGNGFKQNEVKVIQEFRNSSGNLAVPQLDGFVNPTANSELTIFPPLGASANEICRFEPLPDIKCQAPNLRPAAFSYTEQEISSQDWFFDPYSNFPRNQLKYVQEYGRGWFGRVVEGEAQNITPEEKVTKVMVKILHEDATATDHMYFLHEVKFYRDLKHPNILRLLGRCLETEPFLVILECYPNGDLKTFLSQNLASAQALVEQGVTLQMCSNITSGLQYMHANKFIHTDLAARNCLVGPDLSIKIGDYGNSIEVFKSDYYCAGSVALPVRWCAPETLKCTDITIETREVTPPANIWSLGVVFWEICEFCKLPYAELNDDQVIVRVLGEKNYFLEKPVMNCLHKDEMYHLMKLCWKPPVQRPSASQIYAVLNNLISSSRRAQKEVHPDSKRISQDFEQRWHNLTPNSIPKKDNAFKADHSPPVDCGIISSKLKNSKVADSSYVDSPLGIFMASKNASHESPRFRLKFDKNASQEAGEDGLCETPGSGNENVKKTNIEEGGTQNESVGKVEFECTAEPETPNAVEKLQGAEQEVDSWLKGVEINNEEDESFVRKISEAIRDLDATLALEKTSSSEENSGKSSRHNSPGKDGKEESEPVVDFKLGNDTSSFINFTQKSFELSSLQNTEQPQSLNFTDPFSDKKLEVGDSYGPESLIMPFIEESINKCKGECLDESLRENDSLLCGQSRNSSDTDDEIWRRRIEKGEISEKVKEKSKSIANLMILTHIDSDDSDIDLEKPFEKGLNRSSFMRRSGSFAKSSLSSNNFGSENDLTFAVLEDDFKESLKKLTNDHKEYGRFDSLGVILPSSANRENVWESLFKPSDTFAETSSKTTESQTDVNKTEKDSNSRIERFPETNFPEEKSEQDLGNGNNFLGNVASEKLLRTNLKDLTEGKDQSGAPLSEELVKNSEDGVRLIGVEGNIVEECPKCDSEINCSDSLQNSSHLRESYVHFNSAVKNKNDVEDSVFEKLEEDCLKSEGPVEGNLDSRKSSLDNGNFFFDRNKTSEDFETKRIDVSVKNGTLSNDGDNFLSDEDHRKEMNLYEKKGKKNTVEFEKAFEPFITNCKYAPPKDYNFIPQITITEEPAEELIEYENEEFEFKKPNLKALKFVLKDDEVEPVAVEAKPKQPTSAELVSSSTCDDFFPKCSEKYHSGEDATVVVGACEDFTLDYFKGLKTTSEDINVKNGSVEQFTEDYQNDEENLDVWDKHLEKAFTQQLSNANFDDISFRSFGPDYPQEEEMKCSLGTEPKNCDSFLGPLSSITDFIESEKLHTEKLEEPIHINRLTNLSVMANEEDYEHFKLRTPDDERSSDSGFRDKGSLSESVEDACEGKYNLEDIEAELEEAFVKGVFGNCETDKEKNSAVESKNCNFEYEESKFYEDGSKNEEDFSDIDGEIEFWHNKDESDYYPEISEFHPTFSQGWYLHPPDENPPTLERNVNEDIVNALRNELRENLPIQSRSYEEFSDFYEAELDDPKRELNIHYASEFALPLSPILEEQDSSNVTIQKNIKNSLLNANNTNKVRKNIVKLMESVKAVDTNSFMQYLDYMIENEGRDLDETEIGEPTVSEGLMSSPKYIVEGMPPNNLETLRTGRISAVKGEESGTLSVEPLKPGHADEGRGEDDILVVNIKTNEAALLERSEPESSVDTKEEEGYDCLEVVVDNSENEGLVFTPEMLSPDRERSLSETSRSSNGTRTGDALSEITLSSPDLVPDCFSTSAQETILHHEADEAAIKEPIPVEYSPEKTKKVDSAESEVVLLDAPKGINESSDLPKSAQVQNHAFTKSEKNNFSLTEKVDVENYLNARSKNTESLKINGNTSEYETKDLYEMSTSFMGEDDEEDTFSDSGKCEQKQPEEDQSTDPKAHKDLITEDSDTADWQSESSEGEELSSSSGEFIWKDGNKESKIKAACASDFVTESSLYEKSERGEVETSTKESTPKNVDEDENFDGGDDEDEDEDESSTGSSASITDFVPSAWSSQATPSRPALRSPDKKADKQKKNVWFKKQKYHCVYEYPREPSDSEDAEGSQYQQSNFEKNVSDAPIKHFNYGVNTVELPNQHFPYGISKVVDFSSYTDWDVDGEDPDLSLTDTDSENGTGKADWNGGKKSDLNFYNLSPFDYDFNTAGKHLASPLNKSSPKIANQNESRLDLHEGGSEFFVSSSSRPFQPGSAAQFLQGSNQSDFNKENVTENKTEKKGSLNHKDFVTPDSGIEDSTSVTPLDKSDLKQEDVLVKVKSSVYPGEDIINILDNLKINLALEKRSNEGNDFGPFGDDTKAKNCFASSDSPSAPLANIGLGELRHARGKLKLDLPRNHNNELGAIISKRNQ